MAYKIINKTNLIHNINYIRSQLLPQTLICAVVKANAYGHDITNIVPHIDKLVDYYAVNNLTEANELLQYTQHPILILKDFQNYPYISPQIHYTISNPDFPLSSITTPTNFHITINTGMNRLGINPQYLPKLLDKLSTNPNVHITGVYSHISDSTNITRTFQQLDLFQQYTSTLPYISHIASSTNFNLSPDFQQNMVRIGLGLYGYGLPPVLPVMSVYAKIIHTQNIKKGEYIGYGSECIATHNMQIAILDIGYADGLVRSLSNTGYVLINNTPCPILGNICMNMTIIDITHTHTSINDTATILCPAQNAQILSSHAKTIPYEILTNFSTLPTITQ